MGYYQRETGSRLGIIRNSILNPLPFQRAGEYYRRAWHPGDNIERRGIGLGTDKETPKKKSKNTALQTFKQNREQGFIRNRFFAAFIDFVIIGFLCQFAFMLFGTPDLGTYLDMQEAVRGLARDAPEVVERMRLWQEIIVTVILIGVCYEALLLILFGGTAGKLFFGIKVVSVKEDRNIFLHKLLLIVRSAIKGLSIYLMSAIPFIFLCLTTFGNADARSGFDLFSGTKVLYKKRAIWFFGTRNKE